MIMSPRFRLAIPVLIGLGLAACAGEPGRTGTPQLRASPEILAAIRHYYESNAAEENNACSAVIMSGVSRSEVVSDSGRQVVVDVTYNYGNYAHRGSMRCRGFGNRQFTLTNQGGRFQVVGMTGERRLGPSWRLW
jgi:hypothetical protein